jgi:hypothetical protein
MPNWCINVITVTGPEKDIARFKQTCVLPSENGVPCFDFHSLIPMPEILTGTECSTAVNDALQALGRDDIAGVTSSQIKGPDGHVGGVGHVPGSLTEADFEKARQSIAAFEQTGVTNWYVWTNQNWGTKWNASDFEIDADEPGQYKCRFETAWCPPCPIFEKMTEVFPSLYFEIVGGDEGNFAYRAKAHDGTFDINFERPGDPCTMAGGEPGYLNIYFECVRPDPVVIGDEQVRMSVYSHFIFPNDDGSYKLEYGDLSCSGTLDEINAAILAKLKADGLLYCTNDGKVMFTA